MRARPALRRPEDDRGPRGPTRVAILARGTLDLGDPVERVVERRGEAPVGLERILVVEAAGEEERLVATPAQELRQLVLGNPCEHGRIRDLVAVQVQDRQDGPVRPRVEELVAVPARRERPGLGLAVPDDAGDEQVGIVEGGALGVHERVAELAPLVDRARRLRRRVAGDAAGEGELLEEDLDPLRVLGDVRIHLGVGPLEVGVGDHARPTVPRAADVDHV